MSKNKLYVAIAFILLIVILAAVFFWVISSDGSDAPEAPDATPNTTVAPADEPTPEPSAAPTSEPTPSAMPTPTPTPVPTDDGKEHTRTLSESGSFTSDNTTKLNLAINWSVTSKNDEELLVSVTVNISHFALGIGTRNGTVSVGGQTQSFRSPALDIEDSGDYATTTQLFSTSFVVPCAIGESVDLPISVVWSYNGAYSGVDYKDITAASNIHIDG